MGSVNIAVTAPGFDATIKAFRAMPAELKREVGKQSRTVADPLARVLESAGSSQGSHAAGAASTVRSSVRGGVPSVVASGKPYTLGSEFGGGVRRASYYSTSRAGRRYLIVNRRTTAQFRPYVGQSGYWWDPAIKANGPGATAVLEAWSRIVSAVVARF